MTAAPTTLRMKHVDLGDLTAPHIPDSQELTALLSRMYEPPAETRAHPVLCGVVWALLSLGACAIVWGALEFFLAALGLWRPA